MSAFRPNSIRKAERKARKRAKAEKKHYDRLDRILPFAAGGAIGGLIGYSLEYWGDAKLLLPFGVTLVGIAIGATLDYLQSRFGRDDHDRSSWAWDTYWPWW